MSVNDWERVHSGQAWGRWPNTRLVEAFMREFGDLDRGERSDTDVLELGCGTGAQLRFLCAEGFNAHGVDASASAITTARILAPGAWLHVNDITRPEFSVPSRMDCIIDVCTLQHLNPADAARVLHRCRKEWLVDGGVLISIFAAENTTIEHPAHIPAPYLLRHTEIKHLFSGFSERDVRSEIIVTEDHELRHWIIVGRL